MRAFSVWIFNGQQKRRLVLTGWEDGHFVRQLYGLYVLLFTAGFYLVFDQYPEILVICIDLIYMCQTGEKYESSNSGGSQAAVYQSGGSLP